MGRIALKSVTYFEIATTLALIIGLIMVNLMQPGAGVPLNESGETIDSLEKSGERGKVETALRGWLVKNIEELKTTTSVKPS